MIVFLAAATMLSADVSALQGEWARGDGKARVRMEPCGADLCAINTWIKPGVRDESVDDRLIMTLKSAGAMRWTGSAYDPQRKLTYRITITADARSMATKGCVLGGLICKGVTWTRIS
jgi:uncharacterized protein (DUF2147 family)